MSDKQSAEEHLRNFNTIIAQLANINVILEDDEFIDKLLMSLPESWSNFCEQVCIRENQPTYTDLETLLIHQDSRRTRFQNRSQIEEALMVEGGSRSGKGRNSRGTGRSGGKGRDGPVRGGSSTARHGGSAAGGSVV